MRVSRDLRRRIDYQLLRWQARLDGEWADHVLPWASAAALSVVLVALSLARARGHELGPEMARWVQGAWFIAQARSPDLTVFPVNLFEPQASFGFVPLAMLGELGSVTSVLLVAQSLSLGLAVIPLWRLCRRVCSLRVGASSAAVLVYALNPLVHELNLADFHPEVLALPLLLAGTYAALRRHWWWTFALLLAALTLRSDLGLTVAAIGLTLRTTGHERQALRVVAGGLCWTVLMTFVVQPLLGEDGFVHAAAFAGYGATPLEVLWGVMTDPLGALGDVFARESYLAVFSLLAPVALLPLLAPRKLMPFAGVLALAFLADVPVTGPEGVANLLPGLVMVFVALPFALAKIGRRNVERVTVDGRILGLLVLTALMFFTHASPAGPYERPWSWGGRSRSDQAAAEAISMLDGDWSVRTGAGLVANLAGRAEAYFIEGDRDLGADRLSADVDAVLLDASLTQGWSDPRRDGLLRAIESEGFETVFEEAGVVLLVREGSR